MTFLGDNPTAMKVDSSSVGLLPQLPPVARAGLCEHAKQFASDGRPDRNAIGKTRDSDEADFGRC